MIRSIGPWVSPLPGLQTLGPERPVHVDLVHAFLVHALLAPVRLAPSPSSGSWTGAGSQL